jgi:hypothetical protein
MNNFRRRAIEQTSALLGADRHRPDYSFGRLGLASLPCCEPPV